MLKVLPCKILNITALLVLPVSFLLASFPPFGTDKKIYESDRWLMIHYFDWGGFNTLRRELIIDHFSPVINRYGSLTLIDKSNGAIKFVVPVNPISYLWISPDSKYIVALSESTCINPVKILILDAADGKYLYRKTFIGSHIKLTKELYDEFTEKYPHLKIPDMYIIHDKGEVFIDREFLYCMPAAYNTEAHDFLWKYWQSKQHGPDYISFNTSETCTWYNETNPNICLEYDSNGNPKTLSIDGEYVKKIVFNISEDFESFTK